jgi:hypothetical protein
MITKQETAFASIELRHEYKPIVVQKIKSIKPSAQQIDDYFKALTKIVEHSRSNRLVVITICEKHNRGGLSTARLLGLKVKKLKEMYGQQIALAVFINIPLKLRILYFVFKHFAHFYKPFVFVSTIEEAIEHASFELSYPYFREDIS